MAKNQHLDELDIKILKIIQENSQKTLKEIAEQVNLSLSPTHDRVKRLESDGYIQGYVGLLNRKKLNLGLLVHCQVTLEKQTSQNFSEFEAAIKAFPEVISCHLVSGNFDYYLNVLSADVESYNRFYQEKLAVLPSVAHISSLFVMDEIKSTTALPLI
jgi:Lrp/AsnC family transcriptional regulator, leucine-responsive regulatory protein